MTSAAANLMVLAGGACLVYSAALLAPAAGWAVGGSLLLVGGVALAFKGKPGAKE